MIQLMKFPTNKKQDNQQNDGASDIYGFGIFVVFCVALFIIIVGIIDKHCFCWPLLALLLVKTAAEVKTGQDE